MQSQYKMRRWQRPHVEIALAETLCTQDPVPFLCSKSGRLVPSSGPWGSFPVGLGDAKTPTEGTYFYQNT